MYTDRFTSAFTLAFELHCDQTRKGSGIPYVTHLMAVAALVGEHGGDEDQVVAALLHDAAEDQGGHPVLERIREAFGERVAELVLGCSDSVEEPKEPWRQRKERFVEDLSSAGDDLKLIVAADKLHNVSTIIRDYKDVGESVWERFHGRREGSLWYYAAVFEALESGWTHRLLDELAAAMSNLSALANPSRDLVSEACDTE